MNLFNLFINNPVRVVRGEEREFHTLPIRSPPLFHPRLEDKPLRIHPHYACHALTHYTHGAAAGGGLTRPGWTLDAYWRPNLGGAGGACGAQTWPPPPQRRRRHNRLNLRSVHSCGQASLQLYHILECTMHRSDIPICKLFVVCEENHNC